MNDFNKLVTAADDNQDLVLEFTNTAWNLADYQALRALMAPSFFYKNSFRGESLNPDQYIEYIKSFRKSMPDMELEVDEVMSSGNRVIINSLFRGTLKWPLFHVPASDKIIAFPAVSFLTIKEGLVADVCSVIDVLDIERQLGKPFKF